ncbi:MAG: RNA polymerase sigma-70 factor [Bacteroidales bacterium]|nr:RNA polymerase sigma-70 factor [Bacteroidales bacterium]
MKVSGYNIVSQLKNDDNDAYKYLFRTFYLDLYHRAFKYTCHKEDAKDLVQSTFIKVWEKRKDLLEDRPIEPLLYTIHRNNCLDYIRTRKTKINYMPNDPSVDTDMQTPFDQVVSRELEMKIDKAVAELPVKCRQIFEYSRYNDLKYAEIATKLSISVKTVENQISIALDKLRKLLVECLLWIILLI